MSKNNPLGLVFRCPICGAEVTVVSTHLGDFTPRCCSTDMICKEQRVSFYYCPRCGAEIAVLREGYGDFQPHCCGIDMLRKGA